MVNRSGIQIPLGNGSFVKALLEIDGQPDGLTKEQAEPIMRRFLAFTRWLKNRPELRKRGTDA